MDAPLPAGTASRSPGKRAEHVFFSSYFVALAVLVFVSFAPSFYLRGLVTPYFRLEPQTPLILLHGVLSTALVLLFPVQALLIGRGRHALHMRVGKWGFVLGGMVAATGYALALSLYHRAPRPGVEPIVPILTLVDVALIAVALAAAWRWRLNGQVHKRIMVGIACLLVGVVFGRIPVFDLAVPYKVPVVQLAACVLVLPLWAWDLATRRKPHPATLAATAFLAVAGVLRMLVLPQSAWADVVALFPGFGWP